MFKYCRIFRAYGVNCLLDCHLSDKTTTPRASTPTCIELHDRQTKTVQAIETMLTEDFRTIETSFGIIVSYQT